VFLLDIAQFVFLLVAVILLVAVFEHVDLLLLAQEVHALVFVPEVAVEHSACDDLAFNQDEHVLERFD